MSATVHASAVLVGARAVLIRGPSGAGKSQLVLDLIAAAAERRLFGRLVGDDRVLLESAGGRLLVRPAAALAGLIELRGAGILRLDYEPCAVVGLVVDLADADAERLPESRQVVVEGITLPRLGVATGAAALPPVLALLTLPSAGMEFELLRGC
jgi:serine kinase of HPr protein (carbohydrate metabolism regulator)